MKKNNYGLFVFYKHTLRL